MKNAGVKTKILTVVSAVWLIAGFLFSRDVALHNRWHEIFELYAFSTFELYAFSTLIPLIIIWCIWWIMQPEK